MIKDPIKDSEERIETTVCIYCLNLTTYFIFFIINNIPRIHTEITVFVKYSPDSYKIIILHILVRNVSSYLEFLLIHYLFRYFIIII